MIEIICGDCIEVMKLFKDKEFDLCLTDPPYNIGKDYGELVNDKLSYEEYKQFSIDWFTEARRISKGVLFTPGTANQIMWCKDIEFPKWIIAWYKSNKFSPAGTKLLGYAKWEPIYAYDVIKMSIDHYSVPIKHMDKPNHPVPKPVRLFRELLSHTKNIQTVIDPFIGSGTTAIACMELGLDCVGIELNPDYVKEIKARLSKTIPKTNVMEWF